MIRISTLLLFLFVFSLTSVFAQNYWKTYRLSDGIIDTFIVDLAIGNPDIYIATPSGFSVFSNESFTNYDTSNSNLPSNNIKAVRNFNDTIWMITDSGLSRFINGNFTHYTIDSGLVSNELTDIAINSKGDVWAVSKSGISVWSNGTFTNDLSKSVNDIAINKGDTVYANTNTTVINAPFPPFTTELFDGFNWIPIHDPSYTSIIDSKFIELSDGSVGITSVNSGGYVVDDVFTLTNYLPTIRGTLFQKIDFVERDNQGNLWLAGAKINANAIQDGGIHKWDGQKFNHYLIGLPDRKINVMRHSAASKKLYLGSDNGFAIADDTISSKTFEGELNTASISVKVLSNGRVANDPFSTNTNTAAGFEFPKNSRRHLIYSINPMIEAKNPRGNVFLARDGINLSDFGEGPINDFQFPNTNTLIKITRAEIRFHLRNFQSPNYKMPESIQMWPGNGDITIGEAEDMAPFVDVDGSRCYNPENGDYPYILGDSAYYFMTNVEESKLSGTPGLKLELHGMVYVYNQPLVEHIDRSLFIRYTLINRSKTTYSDIKFALDFDADVGNPIDDFAGCEPSSDIFYAYNGDSFDETNNQGRGYGDTIPAVGAKFINQKMAGFISYGGFQTNLSFPQNFYGFRRTLERQWVNGVSMSFGGNGYDINNLDSTEYLYPGDVKNNSEWSAINPGPDYPANQPTPQHLYGMIAPFSLASGERKVIDVVVSVGSDTANKNHLDNIELLIDNLNKAARFQNGDVILAPDFTYSSCLTPLKELKKYTQNNYIELFPNPTSRTINLRTSLQLNEISVFNIEGKLMYKKILKEQAQVQTIELPTSLKNGVYFLRALDINNSVYSKAFVFKAER